MALLPVIAGALLLAGAPSSFTALFIYVVAAAGILLPLVARAGGCRDDGTRGCDRCLDNRARAAARWRPGR